MLGGYKSCGVWIKLCGVSRSLWNLIFTWLPQTKIGILAKRLEKWFKKRKKSKLKGAFLEKWTFKESAAVMSSARIFMNANGFFPFTNKDPVTNDKAILGLLYIMTFLEIWEAS